MIEVIPPALELDKENATEPKPGRIQTMSVHRPAIVAGLRISR